jgi:F0F1-type ATP synthase assembly protein I
MRTSLEKNLTPVARTLSEANRDAQYCSAIQTFKSDAKLTLDFLANAVIGALWVAVVAGAVIGVAYWVLN